MHHERKTTLMRTPTISPVAFTILAVGAESVWGHGQVAEHLPLLASSTDKIEEIDVMFGSKRTSLLAP